MSYKREQVLPENQLPETEEIVTEGQRLARDWQLQQGAFLRHHGVDSEAAFKRCAVANGRIMQHAQIGFRDLEKSVRAWGEIYETCQNGNANVDRYGICLDWTMGLPRDARAKAPLGTGLLLNQTDDFVRLCQTAPVAPHFGDFVLGFPAAVENTCAALAAGCSSIGNLGQYFTFRLPGWDDDIETTRATLTALCLIAAQREEILVHSNLDDGFAAVFEDLGSCYGAVLLERHIVETLIGARLVHCWGHHFGDPAKRLAFHLALNGDKPTGTPGTMIYGNTTGYRGNAAENYANLTSYLSCDLLGQRVSPSGHAVNPVPVMENIRIPDIDEIIDAQLFAARLIKSSSNNLPHLDIEQAKHQALKIRTTGIAFFNSAMTGLAQAGIDTGNAFDMLLALRRIGGRRLEQAFTETTSLASPINEEITEQANLLFRHTRPHARRVLADAGLKIVTASSDIHEHGKRMFETLLRQFLISSIDGGVSVDPETLAQCAVKAKADAILLGTYNGVALGYFKALNKALGDNPIPVIIGGRLNQIPGDSNSNLPVDVSRELTRAGALVCSDYDGAIDHLIRLSEERT